MQRLQNKRLHFADARFLVILGPFEMHCGFQQDSEIKEGVVLRGRHRPKGNSLLQPLVLTATCKFQATAEEKGT